MNMRASVLCWLQEMIDGDLSYPDLQTLVRNVLELRGASGDAFELALRLHEQRGDASTRVALGMLLYYGYGVPVDYVGAVKLFREASELGHAFATNFLGVCYQTGNGVEKADIEEAVRLFRVAIDVGADPFAMSNLASCYLYGDLELDFAEAFRLFTLAMEHGDYLSLMSLAMMYDEGLGVTKDSQQAFRMYTDVWDRHALSSAAVILAEFHLDGDVVPRDVPKALRLLESACEELNPDALLLMGELYLEGRGLSIQPERAVHWFRRAREAARDDGQIHEFEAGDAAAEHLTVLFAEQPELQFTWGAFDFTLDTARYLQRDACAEMVALLVIWNRGDNVVASLPREILRVVLHWLACKPRESP